MMDINDFANRVLERFGEYAVDIELFDEEEMRELNMRARGRDEPTDVLSFPNFQMRFGDKLTAEDYPHDVIDGKLFLGSIALCMGVIERNAQLFGSGERRELSYMIVHGILHLLGCDHEDEADRRAMRRVEEEILKEVAV